MENTTLKGIKWPREWLEGQKKISNLCFQELGGQKSCQLQKHSICMTHTCKMMPFESHTSASDWKSPGVKGFGKCRKGKHTKKKAAIDVTQANSCCRDLLKGTWFGQTQWPKHTSLHLFIPIKLYIFLDAAYYCYFSEGNSHNYSLLDRMKFRRTNQLEIPKLHFLSQTHFYPVNLGSTKKGG